MGYMPLLSTEIAFKCIYKYSYIYSSLFQKYSIENMVLWSCIVFRNDEKSGVTRFFRPLLILKNSRVYMDFPGAILKKMEI